jgi:hypothetical protein
MGHNEQKLADILEQAYDEAAKRGAEPFVENAEHAAKIAFIARNIQNRAVIRLWLSSLLAKLDDVDVDIRKPYTEIGSKDCYSGRTYDERFIGPFITAHSLPCNPTTAFLTPALRNRSIVLTPKVNLVGRPPEVYTQVLELLDAVYKKELRAEDALLESLRQLLVFKRENDGRLSSLLSSLNVSGSVPLSSEDVISLIEQHLKCKNASRLPVLIITAVYKTISTHIKEKVLPLLSHNSADKQTGALGDVAITLIDDERVVTSFEMKMKKVTKEDISVALHKILTAEHRIDNYIFITTDEIQDEVRDFAKSLYDQTGGVEIVILDCISFVRYFLHLFHRYRFQYLEEYQMLVLSEPDSAVSQPVKEALLALRRAAESATE